MSTRPPSVRCSNLPKRVVSSSCVRNLVFARWTFCNKSNRVPIEWHPVAQVPFEWPDVLRSPQTQDKFAGIVAYSPGAEGGVGCGLESHCPDGDRARCRVCAVHALSDQRTTWFGNLGTAA